MVSNDVCGVVVVNSKMSGTPDLTLIFSNPGLIEDCSFHPCVRYVRFEREQVVSFVPPDGLFQLMTYRVVDRAPATPLYCRPTLTWREGSARASFVLGTKPMATRGGVVRNNTGGISSGGGGGGGGVAGAGSDGSPMPEDIRLEISFPACVQTVDLVSDVGTVSVDPATNVSARTPEPPSKRRLTHPFPPPPSSPQALTWIVGRYPSSKTPELSGTLHLAPGVTGTPLESPSATLHFKVEGTSVSGIAIRDLLLGTTEKYKFFKGLRTSMKTGRFQVRC